MVILVILMNHGDCDYCDSVTTMIVLKISSDDYFRSL